MPERKSKRPIPQPIQQIDPRWLLKAIALTFAAALLLGYLSVCLLIYQGSWQRFLNPSATIDQTPSSAFTSIRFDSPANGQPRLTAWWIPADSPTAPTILYLHDGAGSLSTTVPRLDLLHRANLNVFAIDYRGFGQSEPTHPSEARMTEDAFAAFRYLTEVRHLSPTQIIPYGQTFGAVFAARLAAAQPQIPALIIESPCLHCYGDVLRDSKSRFLPMRLLLRDRFDIAATLTGIPQTKLLLTKGLGYDGNDVTQNEAFFRTLPDPKFIVTLGHDADAAYVATLHRFLDENLPGAPR